MALVGNTSTDLLKHGSRHDVEEQVRESCLQLAPGGGWVLSSSGGITNDIPPINEVIAHGRSGLLIKSILLRVKANGLHIYDPDPDDLVAYFRSEGVAARLRAALQGR